MSVLPENVLNFVGRKRERGPSGPSPEAVARARPGTWDVVIPTSGSPLLSSILEALSAPDGPTPNRIFVVDDRWDTSTPLLEDTPPGSVEVLSGDRKGAAAARNKGWRACDAEWIVFLGDCVELTAEWRSVLVRELEAVPSTVGGAEGRLQVPLPADRKATDWERRTAGLQYALWATEDMAYRRQALESVGGFDERFESGRRDGSDLAIRIQEAGWRLVLGRRKALYPIRTEERWGSVRMQKVLEDDTLMRALHGSGWRESAGIAEGGPSDYFVTTAAATVALVGALTGHRRLGALAAGVWMARFAEQSWSRIALGPRTRDEIATVLITSAAIPPMATFHSLKGLRGLGSKLNRPAGGRTAVLEDHSDVADRVVIDLNQMDVGNSVAYGASEDSAAGM